MVIMNDAQWLDRVWRAYGVYVQRIPLKDRNIDHFISWLYQQYGIVFPDQRKTADE